MRLRVTRGQFGHVAGCVGECQRGAQLEKFLIERENYFVRCHCGGTLFRLRACQLAVRTSRRTHPSDRHERGKEPSNRAHHTLTSQRHPASIHHHRRDPDPAKNSRLRNKTFTRL